MVVVHSVRDLHNIDTKGDGRCVRLNKLVVGLSNQSVSTARHLAYVHLYLHCQDAGIQLSLLSLATYIR
jgi:hypothetical protein